jgi:hypothetical protein
MKSPFESRIEEMARKKRIHKLLEKRNPSLYQHLVRNGVIKKPGPRRIQISEIIFKGIIQEVIAEFATSCLDSEYIAKSAHKIAFQSTTKLVKYLGNNYRRRKY